MRILIAGVGGIGRELAEQLTPHDNELILIDSDAERCDALAEEVDALVLHGDATNPEILEKGRISEADALVATTGSDALNTVIAMLGRQMGVDRIVVKLNELGLRAACQKIGVTQIIAPRIAAAANIVGALHGAHHLDFSVVARGGLELVELEAGSAAGRRISQLELPDGVLPVAVLRGSTVRLARADAKLDEEDVLLVLSDDEDALDGVRSRLASEEGPG